jgi:NADPH:quinone reductase-like Zn-dependent oxidoreductase
MKAIISKKYGPPLEAMVYEENVPKPTPRSKEVLIKVKASSVNSADCRLQTANPWLIRLAFGLFRPSIKTFGADVAGVIEKLGENCSTMFKEGDEVFCDLSAKPTFGGYAEYVCASEEYVCKKPSNLTFQQAAALPLASITALQGLRDCAKLKPGQSILINGATSGVGHFAVQIAKRMGASKIIAVAGSTSKMDVLNGLGADECIDSSKVDVTKQTEKYDVVFDCACYRNANDYLPILTNDGVYVLAGGDMSQLTKTMFNKKIKNYLNVSNHKDLKEICDMAESGALKPYIDKVFKLEKTPEALQYVIDRKGKGKVVVDVQ